MLTQVLLVLLGAMGLGAALIVLGARGKRINDHPICRDCAFDLVSVPAGTVTCPECGAGLKRERAIRTGARRKRPLFVGLGAALVLLPLAPIGTAGYGLLTGQDLNNWKPLGLLLWESRIARGPGAQAIAAELLDRYTNSKLDGERAARVVGLALDMQGDESRAWAPEWADIIELALADGTLSEGDSARYRRQAPVLEIKTRGAVGQGRPLPLVAKLKEARVGKGGGFMSMLALKDAKIGDQALKRWTPRSMDPFVQFGNGEQLGWLYLFAPGSRWGWGQSYGEAGLMLQIPPGLPPGRHTLEVTLVTQTKTQGGTVHWGSGVPTGDDVKEHTVRVPLEILSEAPRVDKIKATPELEEKLLLALHPTGTTVWDSGGSGLGGQQQFSVENLPAPVAFEVFWRVGEREWPMGSFTSGKAASLTHYYYPGVQNARIVNGTVSGFKGKKVDVILRPSESALAYTLDQTSMYDGELVLKDVVVDWQAVETTGGSILTAPARSILRSLFGR